MRAAPDPKSENRTTEDTVDELDVDKAALARDGAQSVAARSRTPALSSLLSSARHELRSPLQSIQGFAELLGSEAYGALTKEQHTFVEHILQGSSELSSVLEACLELTELELVGEPLELVLLELRGTLGNVLVQASEATGIALNTQVGRSLQQAFAWLDAAALKRALGALLTALRSSTNKPFRVDVETEGEHACVRMGNTSNAHPPLMSVCEFAERRRTARNLIWLRLATVLLDRQGGVVLVSDRLDYAEVRLRLSRPH